jgi:hypothetical protein
MRYLLGFLVAIGLIILVFVLILHAFSGGTSTSTTKPLSDYANSQTTVEMYIDGPITADQTHYEMEMTVGNDESQIELMQGYQGSVVNNVTYANNSSSYNEFLRALDISGFSKGNTSKTATTNPAGYCAFGNRYSFKITTGDKTNQNFWSTSCGGQGTFKGNEPNVKALFIAQFPAYNSLLNNTNLSQ